MQRVLGVTDLSDASDEPLRLAHAIAVATGAAPAVCDVVPDLHLVHRMRPRRYETAAAGALELTEPIRGVLGERVAAVTGSAPYEVVLFVETGVSYSEVVHRAGAFEIYRKISHRLSAGATGRRSRT